MASKGDGKLKAVAAALHAARAGTPGGQAAAIAGGKLTWESCWGHKSVGGSAVASSTLFQAASIAKTVTSWCILSLVSAGKLDLDAPIGRYVDRLLLPSGAHSAEAVTVRRIMSHTAGLSLSDYPGEDPELAPPAESSMFTVGAERLAIAQPPGAGFRYSGGGWALLQCAIESVTDQSFSEAVRARVLEPLSMQSSSFAWTPHVAASIAEGHDANGRQLPNFRYAAAAAAGLYSTAGDLARFLLAHVVSAEGAPAGRGVLSPRTIEALTLPAIDTGEQDGLWPRYGLGYEVQPLADGTRFAGHGGVNRGWRARIAVHLPSGEGLVVLVNGDDARPIDSAFAAWMSNFPGTAAENKWRS